MGAKKTPRDAGIGGLLVIVGLLLFLGVVVQAAAGHWFSVPVSNALRR